MQFQGAIDCDIHPTLPGLCTLFPYLDDAWRETFVQRGMHELVSNNYPPGAPLSVRPDWRPAIHGRVETDKTASTAPSCSP